MKPRLKALSKQVVVITGASSGIGLVTARRAARAGASVLLISRDAEALRRICEEISAEGGVAAYAVADVAEAEEINRAAGRALDIHGGFDTWINAAGVAIYAPLIHTPMAEHERLFRTNYWGVVNGSLAAVAHFAARGGAGALITVGSIVSDIGTPVLGAYAAAKHAAKGFTDSLRIELIAAGAPVSVTLIKPSGIGTPLGEHAANHMEREARIPPTPYAPDLVADAILHAAQIPRREITVGGVGRLQSLFAAHFPGVADLLSTFIIPLLVDRRRPKTPGDNLYSPAADGRERSAIEPSRGFSLYTAAQLHPRAALAAAALGLLAAACVRGARVSSQHPRKTWNIAR